MSISAIDSEIESLDLVLFGEVDWANETIEALARDLTEEQWQELTKICNDRPEEWQLKFIYGLGDLDDVRAKASIANMLNSPYKEVVLTAMDCLYDANCGTWVPDSDQVPLMRNYLKTHPYYSEQINGLIRRFEKRCQTTLEN